MAAACSYLDEAARLVDVLTFQRFGAGAKTLILIHGFLGSGRNLATLGRRLAQMHPDAQVLLPDLRGHGHSPPLGPDSDLDTLAEDIVVLAEAEAPAAPVHLIGHSLGGRVALAALGLDASRWSSVTLLDIGPSPVGNLGGGLQAVLERLLEAPEHVPTRAAMRTFFLEAGVSASLADWIVMNGQVVDGNFAWKIDRNALKGVHRRSSAQDLWPILAANAPNDVPPVTCVRGGASNYVSDADFARLDTLGVRTGTLAGAGHFVHVDALDALLAWLA